MERDFEQEFRQLKQSEIPDLWDRIEAGLSEKKNMTNVSQNKILPDTNIEENVSGGQIVKKQFAWRRWGTLAAACLCVIIILPAFSLLVRNKSNSADMSMESAAEDSAAASASQDYAEEFAPADDAAAAEDVEAEAYDTAAGGIDGAEDTADSLTAEPKENAPESENGMSEGSADAGGTGTVSASSAESAAETENAPPSESTAAADTSSAKADSAPGKNTTTTENAKTEETDWEEMSEEEKAIWDGLDDGQMLESVVVRIQMAWNGGFLYQALVVQEDADGLLTCEMPIMLVCDNDTIYDFPAGLREEKTLKEDVIYRADLRCDKEQGGFVVLTVEHVEE